MALYLEALKQLGLLEQMHMSLCIVGSRLGDRHDPYQDQPWHLFAPNLTIHAFEPDRAACDEANLAVKEKQVNWKETHFPVALWNSIGKKTLFITDEPSASSLYPTNEEFLRRFEQVDYARVVSTMEIDATTADQFFRENPASIDFMQIDVQGGELAVLEGATEILSNQVLAIVTEVEWIEIYKGQPLFADIDVFLRRQGFSLFNFSSPGKYKRRDIPVCSKEHEYQIGWSNAFYLRDLIRTDQNAKFRTPDQLLKLACLADALNMIDYALEVLIYLTLNYGHIPRYNCANAILSTLANFTEFTEPGLDTLAVVKQLLPFVRQNTPTP